MLDDERTRFYREVSLVAESFFKKPPSPSGKSAAPPANQSISSQSPTPFVDLPYYRNLLYAMTTYIREQCKFHREVTEAIDPLGLVKSFKWGKGLAAAAVAAEDTALSEFQAALTRLGSDIPWISTEVMGLIAGLRTLQEKTFKSTPWLPYKKHVFDLLPRAIGELEDFMSQLIVSEKGFDPRELASDFENAVLRDGNSLRDIQTSQERLSTKYHVSPQAMTFLEVRFSLVIGAMTCLSADVLDVLTKKCPQCAERPKAEAAVCRFCGYRFEQVSELEDRKAAQLRAEETAIAGFRQAIGPVIRQMTGVLNVSVATLSEQVQEELIATVPEQVKEEFAKKARELAARLVGELRAGLSAEIQ